MRFLADECCDTGLVAELRKAGYDVLYVPEERPGIVDEIVLEKAYRENRILITEDKDFGELGYRLKKPVAGIVLIRLRIKERHLKWPRLKKLIESCSDRLPGHFVVLDAQKFRFRPLLLRLSRD